MNKDNKEAFNKMMYAMTKQAAKHSFIEFLEELEITEEQYEDIKKELFDKYETKMYI